jgi:hypothetical protein
MNQDRLSALIKQPDVQRKILSNYHGVYSIGLTLNPANRRQIAIRVRIEGEDVSKIPSKVVLDGETIPIVVAPNFRAPEMLARG